MAQNTTGIADKTVGGTLTAGEFNTLKNTFDNNATDAESRLYDNIVVVKQASDLSSIDSTKVYVLDGSIDMGSQSIEVPSGGLTITGFGFDNSKLTSSASGFNLFTSPVGGSGNLILRDIAIEVTGTTGEVFNLVSDTGFEAIEIRGVNFNGCTSLGYLDNWRQVLEVETGRFGGTPELELRNAMNGYRITTSIVRGISNITALFKAGSGLTFSGRFLTDINCDLPATGALFDFAKANFSNDESCEIIGARITRAGVVDANDSTLIPNISADATEAKWRDNVGVGNTRKYLKNVITTEVATTVSVASTWYPMAGTWTVNSESHFDQPSNGELRLLSGQETVDIIANILLESTAGNDLGLRVTKSTDDGATWPTVITETEADVNNLQGGRDVAIINLSCLANSMNKNDRLRLEVSNNTAANNITAELNGSFIVVAG